jgi:hypothetical protein
MEKPAMQVLDNSRSTISFRICATSRPGGWGQLVRGVVRAYHDSAARSPVPLTVQNFGVLLVGLLLGSRRGFAALALYLAEGAMGMPVFSPLGPGGIAHLLGPTGGFLLAYPLVAWVAGYVMEHGRRSFASRRDRRPSRRSCAFHRRSGLARGSHAFGRASLPLGPLLVSVCGNNQGDDGCRNCGAMAALSSDSTKAQ